MAHHVVRQDSDYDLTYELKKCKECSCSRCSHNGTPGCYIEIAIKEINRYEQAMDSIGKFKEEN
jgi:putative ribosome biogenesis GTPase RsgA